MPGSAKFWDKIAQKYYNKPISDESVYEKKLEITRDYLKPDMKLFEFGCGTGGTALKHAPYVEHIFATDISPNMIDIAKKQAKESNISNVSFEVLSSDSFDFDDESFDVVLGLSIIHLLENWQDVIGQVYKMLKPGGVFVSSTVCISDGPAIMRYLLPVMKFFGIAPYVAIFSSQALEIELKGAGFEIEHSWTPDNKGAFKGVFIVAKKPV